MPAEAVTASCPAEEAALSDARAALKAAKEELAQREHALSELGENGRTADGAEADQKKGGKKAEKKLAGTENSSSKTPDELRDEQAALVSRLTAEKQALALVLERARVRSYTLSKAAQLTELSHSSRAAFPAALKEGSNTLTMAWDFGAWKGASEAAKAAEIKRLAQRKRDDYKRLVRVGVRGYAWEKNFSGAVPSDVRLFRPLPGAKNAHYDKVPPKTNSGVGRRPGSPGWSELVAALVKHQPQAAQVPKLALMRRSSSSGLLRPPTAPPDARLAAALQPKPTREMSSSPERRRPSPRVMKEGAIWGRATPRSKRKPEAASRPTSAPVREESKAAMSDALDNVPLTRRGRNLFGTGDKKPPAPRIKHVQLRHLRPRNAGVRRVAAAPKEEEDVFQYL